MKEAVIDPSRALQQIKIKEENGARYVLDPVRKKYILLTKEEWVRQIFILILSDYFSPSKMAVEKRIKVDQLTKRFDLVIMDHSLKPFLLAEFKRPDVIINERTFQQAFLYHSVLKVPYLLVSNGIHHYLCHANPDLGKFEFLESIPFPKILD